MNKITYKSNSQIINYNNQKCIKKIQKSNKEELFNYLKNKGFNNYLPYIELKNNFEIYRYIEDDNYPKDDKAIELVNVLSSLHTLTTTYQEITIDEIKDIYENINNTIENLRIYYFELQDTIETKAFFSPAEHLLMNNISNIYKALNYSKYKLDEWYKIIEPKKVIRKARLHNNITLEHALKEEILYLINWDKSKIDYVIYDFINFYQNEFTNLEMKSLFKIYQAKYLYTDDELLLFESIISIPPKILLNKTNFINTVEARHLITYIEKTNQFLLKENEENQKEDENKFEEQNNSI